jgi:serine/threonine-protein kinase
MIKTVEISIGNISFKLREDHDFTWLKRLGNVFCVFDQQDSGNICFGIKSYSGENLFVKYAGARTMEYLGKYEDAIVRLKNAIPTYKVLQNPNLINLIDNFSTDEGYAAVFEWFEGQCLHDHWTFDIYPKYTHPKSTYFRFKHLPIHNRLKTFDHIYSFHVSVEKKGYQAVDFYDGSILYNFKYNDFKICDIDFYAKRPYVNTMCWGSKRFNAPEDFIKGEILDEKTNVYNMGATAFSLIGGELDRSIEKWEGTVALFKVAQMATNEHRNDRFDSVAEFYREWKMALK